MTRIISSQITKKLLLQFIQENMDFRKRCVYLQEIILMSRKNDVWRKALTIFFDNTLSHDFSYILFSKN